MPKHVQTYLDGYNVKVAAMQPGDEITDTTVPVELVFHNDDMTDTITVPIPTDIRPQLAALLVGMAPPPDPAQAMADAKADVQAPEVVKPDEVLDSPAEAAGRCPRCGARGGDEVEGSCPNFALLGVADGGALEGYAEAGCAAAIQVLQAEASEADPVERADINDEPNGDGV